MNKKSITDRAKIIQLLVEGNSMRSTSRIAGCSINTVDKLLRDVGKACGEYQHEHLRNLPCKTIQVDEMHSFVGCRAKNVREGETDRGDYWVWTSICADTKLIPYWLVGPRDALAAKDFIKGVAERMAGRIQLTSDGLTKYHDAVEEAFGSDVDYGVLVKQYQKEHTPMQKYTGAIKQRKIGSPDEDKISTSYIERSNLTLRMGCRRFTRKTNAHSKTVENHCHALSLHMLYYNFVRIHGSSRVTPAMAARVTNRLWSLEDMVALAD